VAISPQPVVRSTSCFVLVWGFRGRRIEWRYFRFEQIQDGGAAILENFFKCAISAQPVVRATSCSVIGWGFSIRIAAAILDNFEWPYLRNGSRSIAVIFAIAQLSCLTVALRPSVCRWWRMYSGRCVIKVTNYYWQPIGSRIWKIDWYQKWPWPLFRDRLRSCQHLRHIHQSTLNISETVYE